MSKHSIIATFANDVKARSALAQLQAAGIDREAISVLMSESGAKPHFAIVRADRAPLGAAVGAAAGALVGALVAALSVWLGAGAFPGGPVLAAFAGAGLAGAGGLFIGALIGLGLPRYRARLVEDGAREDRVAIGVYARDGHELDAIARAFARRTIPITSASAGPA